MLFLIPPVVAGFAIYGISKAFKKEEEPGTPEQSNSSDVYKYLFIATVVGVGVFATYKLYQNSKNYQIVKK